MRVAWKDCGDALTYRQVFTVMRVAWKNDDLLLSMENPAKAGEKFTVKRVAWNAGSQW